MIETYINTFIENLIKGIPNLLTALLILIASLYLARISAKVIRRILKVRSAPEGVSHLLTQLTYGVIIVLGAITAMQRFFDVTAFLAGLGIIGFTVGFALQDIMKNFAAGVILLIQQPFHVDEFIGVAGYDGQILEIDLRATEMRALDGRIISIPNADVLANPIINYTRAERRRIELPVGVGYNTDTEVARKVVLNAIQNVPGYIPEPAPMVGFSNFGDSALELNTFFWIDTSKTDPIAAKDAAFTLMKKALDKKGIDIPFPIRNVFTRVQE